MQRPALIILAGISSVLMLVGFAQAPSVPVRFWPIARSTTWEGRPDPRARYMATVGLSEWSSGLRLSGFRGSADLEMVEELGPPGVRKFVRVTALKARVTGAYRQANEIRIHVRPEAKGYEIVAVDVSADAPGTRLTFTFVDPARVEVAREDVLIE